MDIKVNEIKGKSINILEKLKKNKYILIILIIGAFLLILPFGGSKDGNKKNNQQNLSVPEFSLTEEESKLEKAIAQIDGAGRVTVMLTLRSGISQELAVDESASYREDETETDMDTDSSVVTVATGAGTSSAVPVRYYYPEYQGALIICDGGGSPSVRLRITEAVGALTGLGSDKITVLKMKK